MTVLQERYVTMLPTSEFGFKLPRLPRLLEVAALLSPSTLPGELMCCSFTRQGGLTPD